MISKEVELSDGHKVIIKNDDYHWLFFIFSQNDLLEGFHEEYTSEPTKIKPFENFPSGAAWLANEHNVDWDDTMLVADIVKAIVHGKTN